MKKYFLLLGAGALLCSGSLQSCKGGKEPVDLKFNLQTGAKYANTIETHSTTEQSMMGQSMKTNNDMTMETSYDVSAGEGGDKKVVVTYDRIAMKMSSNMANMEYDSKDPGKQDTALRSMGQMINKPFTMIVSDRGEIKRVEGLSEIVNSIGDGSTQEGLEMRKQMGTMFNDTAIRSMMQQSLNIFPDKPVRPGETWKKTYTMAMGPINMKVDNDYKLISVKGGTAHIDVNSKITAGAGNMEGMQNMQINLNGDQKGNIDVEAATGLVTDGKMTQNIKGEINAMGQKIPMTVKTDIHITGKKK